MDIVFQAVFSSRQLFKSPVYLLEAAQSVLSKQSFPVVASVQSIKVLDEEERGYCCCGIVCWLGWQSHFLQLGFLPRKRRSRTTRLLMDRLLRLMFHASLMIGDRIDFMLVTDDSPLSITLLHFLPLPRSISPWLTVKYIVYVFSTSLASLEISFFVSFLRKKLLLEEEEPKSNLSNTNAPAWFSSTLGYHDAMRDPI